MVKLVIIQKSGETKIKLAARQFIYNDMLWLLDVAWLGLSTKTTWLGNYISFYNKKGKTTQARCSYDKCWSASLIKLSLWTSFTLNPSTKTGVKSCVLHFDRLRPLIRLAKSMLQSVSAHLDIDTTTFFSVQPWHLNQLPYLKKVTPTKVCFPPYMRIGHYDHSVKAVSISKLSPKQPCVF